MGERKAKISGEEVKGNNSSRRAITVNFLGISDQPPVKATPKPEKKKKKLAHEKGSTWKVDRSKKPLTDRQEKFCLEYVKNGGNITQAAIEAGYNPNNAAVTGSNTLRLDNVAQRIKELRDKAAKPSIATGTEVMQFFTDVMNGKVKDQFNLEASLSDRTKAAVELAKRTIDLDQKLAGKPDATIEIKLDWKR